MKPVTLLALLACMALACPAAFAGTLYWSWEQAAPQRAATWSDHFTCVVVANYDPELPDQTQWLAAEPNYAFTWVAVPAEDGWVVSKSDDGNRSTAELVCMGPAKTVTWKVTVRVTGTIRCVGPDGEPNTGDDETWQIDATFEDTFEVLSYLADIKVRRMGSGDPWAWNAVIAAGGMAGDIHKAELCVTTTPALSGLALTMRFLYDPAWQWVIRDAALDQEWPTTNAAGMMWGTVTSSDVVDVTRQVELLSEMGNLTQLVSIEQKWDTRSGSAGWEYDPYIYYGEPSPISLTVVLVTNSNAPLPGHNLNFYAAKVVGCRWLEEQEEYVAWVAYNPEVYTQQQVEEAYAGFLIEPCSDFTPYTAFDPTHVLTSAQGRSTTQHTVHEHPTWLWIIDEVVFWASDRDVWQVIP